MAKSKTVSVKTVELRERAAKVAKAIAAFIALLIPLLTVLATAFQDGVVTDPELVAIIAAVGSLLGGTAAVYQIPNKQEYER